MVSADGHVACVGANVNREKRITAGSAEIRREIVFEKFPLVFPLRLFTFFFSVAGLLQLGV